jgi:hypothetical protein
MAIGVVMVVVGVIGVPVCVLAAFLTANPCGAFADSCADYGQTSTTAVVFGLGAVLSAGLLVAGVVMMLAARTTRARERARTR